MVSAHPQDPVADPNGYTYNDYIQWRITNGPDKKCVDCPGNGKLPDTTHFNVTFGTFICDNCRQDHEQFYGHKIYIKAFNECFDPY